jgi:hypothetical protein
MCCLFASLILLGPRFAILVWWIIDQVRWDAAFESFWIALIGWVFAPWTTMMYVLVFPNGVTGFDWVIIGLGIFADFVSWTSGGWSGRRYQTTYQVS